MYKTGPFVARLWPDGPQIVVKRYYGSPQSLVKMLLPSFNAFGNLQETNVASLSQMVSAWIDNSLKN